MISTRVLSGPELDAALPDLARLRIDVFRSWPYLYDGDLDYEESYLRRYRDSAQAVLVGAFDGTELVGAATGTPLSDHAEDFRDVANAIETPIEETFYFAESVLRESYRGRGIGHAFFDAREEWARKLGFRQALFCAVSRPEDHPLRPVGYRSLDPFWTKRGYHRVAGAVAWFSWRDVGDTQETKKPLLAWMRDRPLTASAR